MIRASPLGMDRATHCRNHPERPGWARCMHCRGVICQECATQWDGINYCAACLAIRRRQSARGAAIGPWLVLLPATALLLGALPGVIVWWSANLWHGMLALLMRTFQALAGLLV